MGKPKGKLVAPHGTKWSYPFKSPEAEGIVSVDFGKPVQDVSVIIGPPTAGAASSKGESTPLFWIQIFDTPGGKDPFSGSAVELTRFGMPSSQKSIGKLVFTIEFTKTTGNPVRHIVFKGKDANNNHVSEKIIIGKTKGSSKSPFVYNVLTADPEGPKLVLEISEWPKDDPLVSYG